MSSEKFCSPFKLKYTDAESLVLFCCVAGEHYFSSSISIYGVSPEQIRRKNSRVSYFSCKGVVLIRVLCICLLLCL